MRHALILTIAAASGAVLVAALSPASIAEAQTGPTTTISMPETDAGVMWAPPRQFAAAPVNCPGNAQQRVLIQNYRLQGINDGGFATNTTNVRVGPSGVKAVPAVKANGIVLEPGASMEWNVIDGIAYAVSESRNDAGVILGIICGWGAR